MRWQMKCVVDNVKGLVPFQAPLRRLKRRVVPYRSSFSRASYAIGEGLVQARWLREAFGSLEGKSILEIGTGWEPLVPMLFSLCGSGRVYLTDQTALLDEHTLAGGLESFRQNRQLILDGLHISQAEFDARFGGSLGSASQFLEAKGFVYLAPCDCRSLPLASASLDAITSRSVFEHIPPPVIEDILKESLRLLTPGGLLCHFIDNSDHWEHVDPKISRVNFLQFSDRAFSLTHLNGLHYQNRLRHSQYLEILQSCGFEVLRAEKRVDAGSVEALKHLSLAPRFQQFPVEDLAAIDSYLLARKR